MPKVDLLDLYRGTLSVRRCWLLIQHLPADSATMRAAHPDTAGWSLANHLAAAAVEALRDANWQRAGNDKAPRPPRIPRPGVLDETAERMSATERQALAFLDRQRKREAG